MQLVHYGCGKADMILDMVFRLKTYCCFWSLTSCNIVCVAKSSPTLLALHKLVVIVTAWPAMKTSQDHGYVRPDRYVEDRPMLSKQTFSSSQLMIRSAVIRAGVSISSVVQVT